MDDTVVDACCLINLFAAGELRARLAALGGKWHIPTAVASEALYLHVEQDDGAVSKMPVDLAAFIQDGTVLVCGINAGAEQKLYVELAARLDDGEAMALAIAKTRGWKLSTDDRKGRRLAAEMAVQVLTTPGMMKRWADAASPAAEELGEALKRIERLASFFPPASDPLHAWWRRHAAT
jgi:predicted nucleic acid-binding protein